jgi:hypothetical protein
MLKSTFSCCCYAVGYAALLASALRPVCVSRSELQLRGAGDHLVAIDGKTTQNITMQEVNHRPSAHYPPLWDKCQNRLALADDNPELAGPKPYHW